MEPVQLIFLDSRVWLEFFQEDEQADGAESVIEQIEEEQAVVAPTVLMEVRYQIKRRYGDDKADKVGAAITGFDNLDVVPVTAEVGVYAADLRDTYYHRSDRAMSYADAIHIATAELTGCDKLYTGDPDFEEIDEITTEIRPARLRCPDSMTVLRCETGEWTAVAGKTEQPSRWCKSSETGPS